MKAYSYRADTAVPSFDDAHPVVFMDGECALCTRAARIIARLDRKQEFRICPVQSPLGQAVLRHYGFDADSPTTWLYLQGGQAFGSLAGIIKAGERLGGLGRIAIIFRAAPKPLQDFLYNCIAKSRYRLFGKADLCGVPDEELRRRLIT
jgi:predicted DCC family thiol-disulfide oxidoreductase YuxK